MNYIFILFFVLVVLLIALVKWNLSKIEKIKELRKSVSILNREHNEISKENIQLREFIKIQGVLIDEMDLQG